ncbi:OmpA family protein [Raineya orbicola]|uniref:OmpA family n=1 Tax=Raineya orbicola TaxID=2016530 RepID=A0A2N3IBE9_9BACT|nr:OmpA family protein [Raineya orbicola]PKQ67636.1 OmpA family [Raineya orbicola]
MQKYFRCILLLILFSACKGGKELSKISQKQIVMLRPNPLEMHGGQVRGQLQIKLPAEMQKKMLSYEAQVIFNAQNFTGEILQVSLEKNILQKDTSFAFWYSPQIEYGEILLKAKIRQKKGKTYETPYFTIGRGIITTASLFQHSPEPPLHFYPFETENLLQQGISIFFDANSSHLSEIEKRKLQSVQEPVRVIGFFSPEGKENQNFKLAQKRAEAVKAFLSARKVPVYIQLLSFEEWKKCLQSLLDENLQKQIEPLASIQPIVEVLEKNENQSIYAPMRVVKIVPEKEEKIAPNDTLSWLNKWQNQAEQSPNALVHHQIGTWYAQMFFKNKSQEYFQKAGNHLQTAINLGAKGETYYNYALLLRKQNKIQKSDSLLKIASQKNFTDTTLVQWLNEWQGLQKVKEAISVKDSRYQEALRFFQKSGKNPQSIFNQGLIYLLTYQYDKASQLFEQIQDFSLALYARAIVGMRKGNEQECLEWLAKSFQKDKKLKNKAQKDMEFWQVRENAIMK